MSDSRLLLIRHAESVWNADGRWQGHGDPPLSARGRRQASALADALSAEPIDVLISSDLARAQETAAALAAARGLVPLLDANLRELDIGHWTGLTREQIVARDRDMLARFEAEDPDAQPEGGESRREIRQRVRRAMAARIRQHPGQSLAIVTHLGVIRALLPGREPANAEWISVAANELAVAEPS